MMFDDFCLIFAFVNLSKIRQRNAVERRYEACQAPKHSFELQLRLNAWQEKKTQSNESSNASPRLLAENPVYEARALEEVRQVLHLG